MPLGIVFWIVWIFGICYSVWFGYSYPQYRLWGGIGLWLAALATILGWAEFGPIVK